MNKKIIGVALICLITGLGIGYIIGYFTYPLPVEDLPHAWAILHIVAGAGALNYTAKYTVYWRYGTSIPLTTVNGLNSTILNITRPRDAPVGGSDSGWTIEVWAWVTPTNGVTPSTSDSVMIDISSPTPDGGKTYLRAYGVYPAEAHLSLTL